MTYSSEKLCLRWHEFQQNIVSSYKELHKVSDFSDVTLVCEEDHRIEAHRVILAACSPFFNTVLKKNQQSNPIIYMRGLKAKDLTAVVDFIYHGESNIYQKDLDGFLALAEELQLKGLAGYRYKNPDPDEDSIDEVKAHKTDKKIKETIKQSKENHSILTTDVSRPFLPVDTETQASETSRKEHKIMLDSMMECIADEGYKWKCTVCGKASTRKHHSRTHVETHVKGLSYPCNQCDKVSRTYSLLQVHVSTCHRK